MRPNPAGREGREGYGIERDVYSEGDGCGGHPADGIFALHVLLHDARHGRDAYIWGYRGDIHAVARGECAEYGSYQHGFRPDYERGATGAGGGVSAGNTSLFALCGLPILALQNIFFKNSPLHDGALIISQDRIQAVQCILPLTDNPAVAKRLGLRHRAALGLTERTDALVLVVSEETGAVSAVENGEIKEALDESALRRVLSRNL